MRGAIGAFVVLAGLWASASRSTAFVAQWQVYCSPDALWERINADIGHHPIYSGFQRLQASEYFNHGVQVGSSSKSLSPQSVGGGRASETILTPLCMAFACLDTCLVAAGDSATTQVAKHEGKTDSLEFFKTAHRLFPADTRALKFLATALTQLQQADPAFRREAIEYTEMLASRGTSDTKPNPRLLMNLGNLYLLEGDFEACQGWFQRAAVVFEAVRHEEEKASSSAAQSAPPLSSAHHEYQRAVTMAKECERQGGHGM